MDVSSPLRRTGPHFGQGGWKPGHQMAAGRLCGAEGLSRSGKRPRGRPHGAACASRKLQLCVLWSCPPLLLSQLFHGKVESSPPGEAQHKGSFEGTQQRHFAGNLWPLDTALGLNAEEGAGRTEEK